MTSKAVHSTGLMRIEILVIGQLIYLEGLVTLVSWKEYVEFTPDHYLTGWRMVEPSLI
ncbi:hypothetical protein BR93DRAFT_830902 [Coniochaeta sp. PMI_546]|nr:hypothetical protein BR93DRAFT_830902 [Coniochaeta sp. PMI_546]